MPRQILLEREEAPMLQECPKCGKHSLVAQANNEYACIGCNFRRNLSTPSFAEGVSTLFVGAIVGLIILLLL